MSSEPRPWHRDPENLIRLLTLIGGLVAFWLGLREFREEQRWKRLALFTEQLQAFEAEPAIGNALLMLDYREPVVCVPAESVRDPERRCTQVTDSMIVGALSSLLEGRVLSDQEHQVVYALDRLLTALDRIDYLHEQRFLGDEVQHPTVAYWIQLIGDRRATAKQPAVKRKLCEYVRAMKYVGALNLVAQYTPAEHRVEGCTLER
jgi:hypothetical protein